MDVQPPNFTPENNQPAPPVYPVGEQPAPQQTAYPQQPYPPQWQAPYGQQPYMPPAYPQQGYPVQGQPLGYFPPQGYQRPLPPPFVPFAYTPQAAPQMDARKLKRQANMALGLSIAGTVMPFVVAVLLMLLGEDYFFPLSALRLVVYALAGLTTPCLIAGLVLGATMLKTRLYRGRAVTAMVISIAVLAITLLLGVAALLGIGALVWMFGSLF